MTSSEPAANSNAATLLGRLSALQEALGQGPHGAPGDSASEGLSASRREQLKQEIIALFRDADAALVQAQAVKDAAKQLAEQWKQLPSAAPDAPREHAPSGPARVDHLGASTFIEKGWSKLSLGDAVGAAAALHRALDLAPGQLEAEALLAWAQMEQGQYEAARERCEAILRTDPKCALAYTNLGFIGLRTKRYAQAVEHLSHAIAIGTDRKATLYAHLYLGMIARERALFDEADSIFRKTLELGPNLLQAWYEIGFTYWESGRRPHAIMAWKTGAQANKFSPWGKRCAELVRTVEQGGEPLPGETARRD